MRTCRKVLALIICLSCLPLATVSQASSWGHINQELARPEGWLRLVEESGFPLGDRSPISASTPDAFIQAYGAYPSLDGSTVAVPMAMEFARQHLTLSDADIETFVQFSTTHSAYVRLIEGSGNPASQIRSQNTMMDPDHPIDLLIATEPSDEELALAEAAGVSLHVEPVCYDAFVFITHRANPVESLTTEQLRGIYSGEITNWSEVGGEDLPITAFQREKNSGSQTAMENLVMQGTPFAPEETVLTVVGMGDLVNSIAEYRNDATTIGYTYLYYIETLYKHDDIKVLQIDGASPTPANIRSGSYPFTTNYNAIIRFGEEDGVPGQFLAWMLSDEGQRCIQQAGYIPMRAMP